MVEISAPSVSTVEYSRTQEKEFKELFRLYDLHAHAPKDEEEEEVKGDAAEST